MKAITNYRDAQWDAYIKQKMEDMDKAAYKKIMATKEGRWFYIRILQLTGYEAKSFTGNSQTFYNEGRRAVGIEMNQRLMDLHGHDGFVWKQKAEKEFVEFQEAYNRLFSSGKDD